MRATAGFRLRKINSHQKAIFKAANSNLTVLFYQLAYPAVTHDGVVAVVVVAVAVAVAVQFCL